MKKFSNYICNKTFADNECNYCEGKRGCDLYYQWLDNYM